jgi:hypothetical protein
MDRTAEEFPEQLPSGDWIIADNPGNYGRAMPGKLACFTKALRVVFLTPAEAQASRLVIKYSSKRACKRAAQRMLDRVLDDDVPLAPQLAEMKGEK